MGSLHLRLIYETINLLRLIEEHKLEKYYKKCVGGATTTWLEKNEYLTKLNAYNNDLHKSSGENISRYCIQNKVFLI